MSSPVYLMTHGKTVSQGFAARTADGGARRALTTHCQPCLTVPLLCSRGSGLQVEGADQVEGGIAEGHAVDTGPQVKDVSLPAALPGEAVKDVLLQVDAEALAAGVAAVDRARAASLRAPAAQPGRKAELIRTRPTDHVLDLFCRLEARPV